MPSITVTAATQAHLQLLASAWETDVGGAVSRLIERMVSGEVVSPVTDRGVSSTGVEVHALYDGRRLTGVYETSTRSLTVTSSPLEGITYKSPSGAAIAVVQSLNPSVNPNRNGWTFWTVSATGATLQSVRHT